MPVLPHHAGVALRRIRRTLAALGCGLAVAALAPAAHATTQGLRDPHPCRDDDGAAQPGFTCWKLTVPLDHSGRTPGTLDLQVGAADGPAKPKGTLLFLTGGPGQEGVALLRRITGRMPEVFKQYRLVMLDQRGTGPLGAIDCPAMQAQVSGSDSTPATPEAVDECSHPGLRLVAAYVERDAAAATRLLQARSKMDLTIMIGGLARLANATLESVTALGAVPLSDTEVERRTGELVSEVGEPLNAATAHLFWRAFSTPPRSGRSVSEQGTEAARNGPA